MNLTQVRTEQRAAESTMTDCQSRFIRIKQTTDERLHIYLHIQRDRLVLPVSTQPNHQNYYCAADT